MPVTGQIAIANTWTKVVDNALAASIQNLNGYPVEIFATSTSTAPAETSRGFIIAPGDGLTNITLSNLFVGVSGAAYLWARVQTVVSGIVAVSHA